MDNGGRKQINHFLRPGLAWLCEGKPHVKCSYFLHLFSFEFDVRVLFPFKIQINADFKILLVNEETAILLFPHFGLFNDYCTCWPK